MIDNTAQNPDAIPGEERQEPIDIRLYVGMLFFRWKIIVVCFLYALLGAVLYLDFATPQYLARGSITVSRDRTITVTEAGKHWAEGRTHAKMLESGGLAQSVVSELAGEWGAVVGGEANMLLNVNARAHGDTVVVSVESPNRAYAMAFINRVLDKHASQWQSRMRGSTRNSLEKLERQMALTEERIEAAEAEVIEYMRLNDLMRENIRSSVEEGFIKGIIRRRIQLETRLFMMETVNPELKRSNFAVIGGVERLTDAVTASAESASAGEAEAGRGEGAVDEDAWIEDAFEATALADRFGEGEGLPEGETDEPVTGFVATRLRLIKLQKEKETLLESLDPSHPRVRSVVSEIRRAEQAMESAAELKRANLADKHKSMLILLQSLEAVEYKWQAGQLQDMARRTELQRLRARADRYSDNYRLLYRRYHELLIAEETKTERFRISSRAVADTRPVSPDATRAMLLSLVVGLGAGLGLAVALQFLDNRIQTIKDVESGLGISFLGGIPYWVHSGLERTIRPIVTEEHSTGAIEAYRALRTTITNEVAKQNEKTIFITSADSREGKTLTALNLAIMTAQMGKKVLLIDMDLRRGRLHRSLGQQREPGVTDALAGGRSLKDVIQSTRIEGLDLVPSGGSVEGSAELLQSTNVLGALVELQDDYDYIYIDTSPILRVTDTVILATQGIGVVVYVARVNHTPKPLIRYSLDMLKEANVLGLIMNSIEMHKISSLYYAYQYPNYAYYSNAYAYGYNYYHYGEQKGKAKKFRRQAVFRRAGRGINRWFRETFFPMD